MDKEKDIRLVIAENINRYWNRDEFVFSALARKAGLQTEQFRLILQGKAKINVVKLQKLAEILHVKTIDLIEDWGEF